MVKTHAGYVLVIALLLGFAHVWLSEHDARVVAENSIKQFQTQIKANDAQAAAAVTKVRTIVRTVRTPAQVVEAAPQLTDVPLNTRVSTDNPSQVSVDATSFIAVLGQAKEDSINLAACKSDLQSEVGINTALKKKPKFFVRIKHVAEAVGIGIGIGLFLSGHL